LLDPLGEELLKELPLFTRDRRVQCLVYIRYTRSHVRLCNVQFENFSEIQI
jgi:hypothetical protein